MRPQTEGVQRWLYQLSTTIHLAAERIFAYSAIRQIRHIVSAVAFRPCQPDVTLFPVKTWNRPRSHVLRKEGLLPHYQEGCRFCVKFSLLTCARIVGRLRLGPNCYYYWMAAGAVSYLPPSAAPRLPCLHGRPGYPGAHAVWADAGAIVDLGSWITKSKLLVLDEIGRLPKSRSSGF